MAIPGSGLSVSKMQCASGSNEDNQRELRESSQRTPKELRKSTERAPSELIQNWKTDSQIVEKIFEII